MRPHLLFVDVGYACFGVEVSTETNNVVSAPPIARWMIGQPYRTVWLWVQRKAGQCRWVRS